MLVPPTELKSPSIPIPISESPTWGFWASPRPCQAFGDPIVGHSWSRDHPVLWGLWGRYFTGFKAETKDFTPILGTQNTFLAGRDGAGQDQGLAALGVLCSLLYSHEEQNGIQSRTCPAFIFAGRKFPVLFPITVIISGIRI